jgi:O-antigen/teichoic acid export membrane protein
MLLRHSASYLLARILPGLVNFVALALYTRLLTPDEYGRYALVIAGVALFNVFFFQWIRVSLLRFLPAHLENPSALLTTILAAFAAIAFVTGGLGFCLALLWHDPIWQDLIAIAVPLLWAQAWLELNLELARSTLQPGRYGLLISSKAVGALVLGIILIHLGLREYGPLLGLLIAMIIVGVTWGRQPWSNRITRPSKELFTQFLHYGLPLTATFALSFIISTSDRFMIAYFIDDATAGIFSASYDLASHSLTLLMVTVNLAAYPLVVRALEHQGIAAAQEQLHRNATLLCCVALPSTVGLALLTSNIASTILGDSFREETITLLPWIAISILFAGLRAYYFDLAFQLGRKTIIQTWIVGSGACANLSLNIWLIPLYGALGAAYATFAAYGITLLLSIALAHKAFAMPLPWQDVFKISAATTLMSIAILPTLSFSGVFALAGQIILGIVVYAATILIMNVGNYRNNIIRRFA